MMADVEGRVERGNQSGEALKAFVKTLTLSKGRPLENFEQSNPVI